MNYFSTCIATLILFVIPFSVSAAFGDTSNFVGALKYGDGKFRTDAYFDFPEDIVSDGNGNFYIADTHNSVIRKIDTNGTVSTAVGQGGIGDKNDTGAKSLFYSPKGVALDSNGNIYIADTGNGKIKKFSGGKVYTLKSDLKRPEGIFIRNNIVYFTDATNNSLYSMNRDGGSFRVITNKLNGPKKLYVRTSNDYAYIANSKDYTVVRVTLSSGAISVIAGIKGTAGHTNGDCIGQSKFRNVWGLTVIEGDSINDDTIYVTDGTGDRGDEQYASDYVQTISDDGKIRKITQGSDCQVSLEIENTVDYSINFPTAITRYGSDLYPVIMGTGKVAKFQISDPETIETYAGKDHFHNKDGLNGLPGRPKALAINKAETLMYFTENNQIKKIDIASKRITHVVGNTIDNYARNDDAVFYGTNGRFSDAIALALSPADESKLYVVDRNNNRIREVDTNANSVGYLTGAGKINAGGNAYNDYQEGTACPNEFDTDQAGCAYFSRPAGIAIDKAGKFAYVADTGNHVIRRVTLTGPNRGNTKLIAGSATQTGYKNGKGNQARFNVPIAITINKKSTALFVADRNNHAIRKISLKDNSVTTLTGDPKKVGYRDGLFKDSYLNLPVAVYFYDKNIFFTEAGTLRVRVADMRDGAVKLVAGTGVRGYTNGDRTHSQFDAPLGIVHKGENLFVADSNNDIIRRIKIIDFANIPYTDLPPSVTSVTPNSNKVAGSTTDTKALSIKGTRFSHGAVAYFGPYKANQTFVNSSGELSVVIPFGKMAPGYYQIKVVNIDGQYGTLLRGYSVSDSSGNVPLTDHWAN